jgi:hypothetical protein
MICVGDPDYFLLDLDQTLKDIRIRILTNEFLENLFLAYIFFGWKYAPKSIFLSQKFNWQICH